MQGKEEYSLSISGSKKKSTRKRRSRSAAGERNYVCGCGKAYLSYPALYTHVKNKHDGTFPEGSILKKFVKPEDEISDYVTAEKKSYENEIRGFLRRLQGASCEAENGDDDMVKKDEIMKQFPLEFFQHPEQFENLKETLKSKLKESSNINASRMNGNIPSERRGTARKRDKTDMKCDEIFSLFIIDFSSYITPAFCKEFLIFICLLRKAYNDHGGKLKARMLSLNENAFPSNFCEGNDINYLPELSNIFISEFFPAYYEKELKDSENLKYLGLKDEVLINLIYLMKFFCNWLLIHDFTVLKLEINTDP